MQRLCVARPHFAPAPHVAERISASVRFARLAAPPTGPGFRARTLASPRYASRRSMLNRESTPSVPRAAGVPIPPDPTSPEVPHPGGVPLPEPEHEPWQEPWQDPEDPYRKVNMPPERTPGAPIEVPEPSLPT